MSSAAKSFDILRKSNLTLNLQFISISKMYAARCWECRSHGVPSKSICSKSIRLPPLCPLSNHIVFPHSVWSSPKNCYLYFTSNIVLIFSNKVTCASVSQDLCVCKCYSINSNNNNSSIAVHKNLSDSNPMRRAYVERTFVLFPIHFHLKTVAFFIVLRVIRTSAFVFRWWHVCFSILPIV